MNIRYFKIEADELSQHDFELIHRYIRKRLDPKTSHLVIKSMSLSRVEERLIFGENIR